MLRSPPRKGGFEIRHLTQTRPNFKARSAKKPSEGRIVSPSAQRRSERQNNAPEDFKDLINLAITGYQGHTCKYDRQLLRYGALRKEFELTRGHFSEDRTHRPDINLKSQGTFKFSDEQWDCKRRGLTAVV